MAFTRHPKLPLGAACALAVGLLGGCSDDTQGMGSLPDAGTDAAQMPADGPPGADAAGTCTGRTPQPADATWMITSGGMMRMANVHVPPSYDPARPMAVVLNFHGFTSNAAQQDLLSHMNAKADASGFVAVHPEGTGAPQSWNAGACCGAAVQNNVDDVGFVSDLIDALEAQLCVDAQRIFSTGMSNGGFLSHRLGCELSARIAAIAPVAGVLGIPTCTPGRPVPILEFHGTSDPLVAYDGNTGLGFPSVPDTFAGWAMRDGCTGDAVETYRNMDAHCSTYSTCSAGSEVGLCTVDGGGHTWPGGTPVPGLGYTTPYLSATDAMWTFFSAHPMP